MKNFTLITSVALTLVLPTLAWSQNLPPNSGGNYGSGYNGMAQPLGNSGGYGSMGQKSGSEEHFQEHKAEILRHMSEHLSEIQQRMKCVQAATNHEALRTCLPERGEERGNR